MGIPSGLSGTYTQIATNLGYQPNTQEMFDYISDLASQEMTPTKLNELVTSAGRVSQFGSQLGGYLATPGAGNRIVANMPESQLTQGRISAMGSTASLLERYGYNEPTKNFFTSRMGNIDPIKAQSINAIASNYGAMGGEVTSAYRGLMGEDYSVQELSLATRISSGDLGALSYASRTDALGGIYSDPGNQYLNFLGEPTGTRDGMAFIEFAQAHGIGPANPITNGMAGILKPGAGVNALTGAEWFQGFLGHSNMGEDYYEAWAEGGAVGAQNLVRERQADLSLASAGIALQSLNANRAYNWGATGTWDQPTSGSSWGLQDTLREMQYQSTLGSWEYQEEATGKRWAYQQQSNAFTQQRMDISRGYQDTSLAANREMNLRKRTWTQEDWNYQDQLSSLSYEWGMEDINEGIRSATGRDRRTLVTQRERMTTKYNLAQEQTDTQHDRQEEIWAAEDERFDEQKQYQEELMNLEQTRFDASVEHQEEMHDMEVEDFDRRKEEYEEQRAIETEMRDLQREHQAEMMDLQEQSIGIQAASAALQKQSATDQALFLDQMRDKLGIAKENWEYGGSEALEAMAELFGTAGDVDFSTMSKMEGVFRILTGAGISGNASAIESFINTINGVNISKLSQLSGVMRTLE